MKKYRDPKTGKIIAEIYNLSFLRDKDHPYGWLKRHMLHFRIKIMIHNTDKIYVPDATMAIDLIRYYFIPKEKIVINSTLNTSTHKP